MNEAEQRGSVKTAVRPVVYIIDDDSSVRIALARLLVSAGFRSRVFSSAADFLKADVPLEQACVITDVRMQGLSGLDLQQELRKKDPRVPVIFVTACDTEETRMEVMRAGASAYFRKPVDDQALIDSIEWALSKARGGAWKRPRT